MDEPRLLRYSWADGNDGGDVTQVAYRLEPHARGTRFTYEHTGFTGVGGLFMARLLGRVRTRMLSTACPRSWATSVQTARYARGAPSSPGPRDDRRSRHKRTARYRAR